MTITTDDLRAAVAQGLLTEEQSARLISLSDARRMSREGVTAIEEPFVLFNGFNEIFVVVGLVILFSGWVGVALLLGLDMAAPRGVPSILLSTLTLFGLAWVARYFTLRRRMVAPSMALVVMAAMTAIVLGHALAGSTTAESSTPLVSGVVALVVGLWYRVFRVPFAAAVIAVALFCALWSVLEAAGILPRDGFFAADRSFGFSAMTILFGLATFALAMRLDMSDPMRVSTRSSAAFWLHIVAAPAIVNTVAVNLLSSAGPMSQALLLGFLLLIAAVAIVIDRRSFLVSAAGYSVALAVTTFSGAAPIAILILGGLLVLLGAQWHGLRSNLMNSLPDFAGKTLLPPYSVKS